MSLDVDAFLDMSDPNEESTHHAQDDDGAQNQERVSDTEVFKNVVYLGQIVVDDKRREFLELRAPATGEQLDWIEDRCGPGNRTVWFNYEYDGLILAGIRAGFSPEKLWELSKAIITSGKKTWEIADEFRIRPPKGWDTIDLMHYKPGDGGLKKYAARMGRDIRDFTFDPDKPLPDSEVDSVLSYLFDGDLESTLELLEACRGEIAVRAGLEAKTGINGLMSMAPASAATKVVCGLYCTETGVEYKELKDAAARHREVPFTFKVPHWVWGVVAGTEVEQIARQMDGKTIVPLPNGNLTSKGWPDVVSVGGGGLEARIGFGGIHTCDPAGDLSGAFQIDVTSLYPHLILKPGGAPQHMNQAAFAKVYRGQILEPRIEAKRAGDKITAAGLKLTANTPYGKMNEAYSPLYSPRALLNCTASGQLVVLVLMERLHKEAGCVVLSANTDGIVFRGNETRARAVVEQWQKDTGLNMEWTRVIAGRASSINEYALLVQEEGKEPEVKGGGALNPDPGLSADWEHLVVVRAVVAKMVHGTDLAQTIQSAAQRKEILLFTSLLSAGGDYHYRVEGRDLGRLLRIYRSTNPGKIQKIHRENGPVQVQGSGSAVLDGNAWPESDDVDIDWYIRAAELLWERTSVQYQGQNNQIRDWLSDRGFQVLGVGGAAARFGKGKQEIVLTSTRSRSLKNPVDRNAGCDRGLAVALGAEPKFVCLDEGRLPNPIITFRVGDSMRAIHLAQTAKDAGVKKGEELKAGRYYRDSKTETVHMVDGSVVLNQEGSNKVVDLKVDEEVVDAGVVDLSKITNEVFIRSLFGQNWAGAHVCAQRWPVDDPDHADEIRRAWFGGLYRDKRAVIDDPDRGFLNRYVSVGVFYPDPDGTPRRRVENLMIQSVFMIDDLGDGAGSKGQLLSDFDVELDSLCAAQVETSEGNRQAWFRLDPPITDPRVSDVLVDGFVRSGLMTRAQDPGMKGCNRYGRLPRASNNKLKYGEPFSCRLVDWHPERTVSPVDLARLIGIEDLEGEAQMRRSPIGVDGLMGEEQARSHSVIKAFEQIGSLKSDTPNRRGWWEVACPWVDSHTGAQDDGTAVTIRSDGGWGFHCFHSHTEGASECFEWLRGKGFDVVPPWFRGDHFEDIDASDIDFDEKTVERKDQGVRIGSDGGVDLGFLDNGEGIERSENPAPSKPKIKLKGGFVSVLSNYRVGTIEEARVSPETRWLLESQIPLNKAGTIIGEGNAGKTTICCHLGAHLAAGLPSWGGFHLHKAGSFWLFSGDDSTEDLKGLKSRLMHSVTQDQPEEDQEQVERAIHQGLNLLSVSGMTAKFADVANGNASSNQIEREIVGVFKAQMDYLSDRFEPPAMIVFDTLRSFAGATVNDDRVASIATETMKLIGDQLGVTTAVNHHLSKTGAKSGGIDASSGSKAITDNLRWVWNGRAFLNRDGEIEQRLVILEEEEIQFGELDSVICLTPERGSILNPQGESFFLWRRGFDFKRIKARFRRKNEAVGSDEGDGGDSGRAEEDLVLRTLKRLGGSSSENLRLEIGRRREAVSEILEKLSREGLVQHNGKKSRGSMFQITDSGVARLLGPEGEN